MCQAKSTSCAGHEHHLVLQTELWQTRGKVWGGHVEWLPLNVRIIELSYKSWTRPTQLISGGKTRELVTASRHEGHILLKCQQVLDPVRWSPDSYYERPGRTILQYAPRIAWRDTEDPRAGKAQVYGMTQLGNPCALSSTGTPASSLGATAASLWSCIESVVAR